MKTLLSVAILAAMLTLSCCTSPPISKTTSSADSRGAPLGDTGIRVSGTVNVGGATAIR